jgi:hypothetical protein
MRRRNQQPISPWHWLFISIIVIIGAGLLAAVFWQVFVNPAPPDFSDVFATATQPPATVTATVPSATPLPPSPTTTQLPALLEATPTQGEASVPTETPLPSVSAIVDDNGLGLNMRAGPDASQPIVARLLPLTPLTVVGRSADSTWLLAVSVTGDRGWVSADFVTLSGSLDVVPVATEVVNAASLTPTASDVTSTPVPPSPADSGDYPYILGITDRAREIFLAGQQLGNRANVFSKVGDSITANEDFLIPVGRGSYNLADYGYLQSVIDYFSIESARHGNSFVNDSLSANPGWSSWTAINYHAADESACIPGELPIECELRMVKPSLVLIMLGTNDVPDTDHISATVYKNQMRKIIETCITAGAIPVVSTLPPFHRDTGYRVAIFNDVLVKLTDEYDIPLWNYWAAVQNLPEEGLSSDGVHPSVSPTGATDFSNGALRYGMNVRNLTALQALDAVWREVIRN